jgi:hypothetical protein
VRCVPNAVFGDSSIGFYRNGNLSVADAGDFWAVGHHAYGPGDRHFGIGCHGVNLCFSISPAGVVNIPYSLTVGNVAVQKIPYVSCRVDGPNVSNRGGQVIPSSSVGASGQYDLTITPPHPAGANLVPQVTLIGEHGYVLVNPSGNGQNLQIKIANVAIAPSTLSFYLVIL